jgi:hypothetical protein
MASLSKYGDDVYEGEGNVDLPAGALAASLSISLTYRSLGRTHMDHRVGCFILTYRNDLTKPEMTRIVLDNIEEMQE